MENQHRVIKGYRDLSQSEIDLMNKIKEHEAATLVLVRRVHQHLQSQVNATANFDSAEEQLRIANAEPYRWAEAARKDLQDGFMALVRAVAQPLTP